MFPLADKIRAEMVKFSRNGRKLAVTSENYSVRLFDSDKGARDVLSMRGHTGKVMDVAFSQGERLLSRVGSKSRNVSGCTMAACLHVRTEKTSPAGDNQAAF